MQTTIDGLLNKRVFVEQPKEGYRIAVDTILLASAVPAVLGETVLELGCGVGGAMLCLAKRVPSLKITGLEIQQELVDLCHSNIRRNGFINDMLVERGDVAAIPASLCGRFDHVMMNPPYNDVEGHSLSPNNIKQIANAEVEGDLAVWIDGAFRSLRDGGTITMIHRADRLDRIVELLRSNFGRMEIKPIFSKKGSPAKRVLLRARIGSDGAIKTGAPLIMHSSDGKYTNDAEKILRHIYAINFD